MDLIHLLIYIIVLCIIGGIVWYLFTLMPLPAPFKTIAMIALCLIFILVLLSLIGVIPGGYRVGSIIEQGRLLA